MSLELDEAKLDRGRSLEDSHDSVVQVLNETVISGKVGALTLDPQYLKVEPLQSKYKLRQHKQQKTLTKKKHNYFFIYEL